MEVYKITNKLDGRVYIGCTVGKGENRFKGHIKDAWIKPNNHALAYDLRKYGWLNFELEILESIKGDDQSLLKAAEDRWIHKFYSEGYSLYNQNYSGNDPSSLPSDNDKTSELDIIFSKEELTNGLVSAIYYKINDEQVANKNDLRDKLLELGVDLSLAHINLILSHRMIPKNVTSRYPNLKYIDNVDHEPTRYYYNDDAEE